LYYSPIAGRGELTRLIAAVGGVELEEVADTPDKGSFGWPAVGVPCLAHGRRRMAQSVAIEYYMASVGRAFAHLSEAQRARDSMMCKLKDDMLEGFASALEGFMKHDSRRATASEDVANLCRRWLPLVEGRIPAEGFLHGLGIPTAGDLAVLNMAQGFMPFGAVYMIGNYDFSRHHPKFAAHAERVAGYPAVQAYLQTSTSMANDPFRLRAQYMPIDSLASSAPDFSEDGLNYDQPRPSSALRKDDVVVSFDDLPSGRLDVPAKTTWEGSRCRSPEIDAEADAESVPYEDGSVWLRPPGETKTTNWRPTETSLSRDSYNSIIQRNLKLNKQQTGPKEKFDVSEVLIKDASMSRQAQMGPEWTPSGLLCRKMADSMVYGEPLGSYSESVVSTPLDTPPTRSKLDTYEPMPRPPRQGQASARGARARRNLRACGIVR
jgi:glutathione S-transferase